MDVPGAIRSEPEAPAWQSVSRTGFSIVTTVAGYRCGLRFYDGGAGWDGDATVYIDNLASF